MSTAARIAIAVVLFVASGLSSRWIKKVYPDPVFQLETAFTTDTVAKEIAKASPKLDALHKSIYIDFLFIPCYTALLWFLCRWEGNRLFTKAALIAGALDFLVENPIMLLEIGGRSNAVLTFVKALGSSIKWLLLLFVVAHVLDALALWLQKSLTLQLRRE